MDPKTAFGCDFLYVMRTLQLTGSENNEFDSISDAASRLFLVMWGFSVDEVDSINKIFFDKLEARTLDSFDETFNRIAGHVKKDRIALERLVIQSVAIAYLDFVVSTEEAQFVKMYQEPFDLRPSEMEDLFRKGIALSVGLSFFGSKYAEQKNSESHGN